MECDNGDSWRAAELTLGDVTPPTRGVCASYEVSA
jgi:hypothetical protein